MTAALRTPQPPPRSQPVATANIDLDAYLARIGYAGPRTPTLKTLCEVAERHPAAIAFEAIDVLLNRGVDLAPTAVDAKLLVAGRGGYCFEQNNLLQRALLALGFDVTGLAARVRWQLPADALPSPRSHMALKISLDGESWLVDAGFGGCTPTTPLNLNSRARQRTTHEAYRFTEGSRGKVLEADLNGDWAPVYEFTDEPHLPADYAVYNWHTSTHPSSFFRHTLIASRVTPEARYALWDGRLSVRRSDGHLTRNQLDADGIEQALAEVFGLPVEPNWRGVIERAARVTP